MHILVAYDGTRGAREAARFIELIAAPLRAEITLLAVSAREQRSADFRRQLDELATRLSAHDLAVRVRMVTGKAGSAILGALAAGDHDLVALGSHGDNMLSRLLGSTTKQIVHRSRVSVLVAHRAPQALERILVCTAGEAPHTTGGLDLPAQIAAATGSTVEVLHVMSQVPSSPDMDLRTIGLERTAEWHRAHHTEEGEHLTRLLGRFTAHHVPAEAKIRYGLVVDEIIAEARSQPADLVVLGAHDRPGVLPLLLEDITEHVIDRLNRPILVVKGLTTRDAPTAT